MIRSRSPLDIVRAKARKIILESKRSFWHKYCNSLKSNSHLTQFWRTINFCFWTKILLSYTIPAGKRNHKNSSIPENSQHETNMLAQQFQSVSKTHFPSFNKSLQNLCLEVQNKNLSISPQYSNLNSYFPLSELKWPLKKKSKAPGTDNLCYEMFLTHVR